MFIVHCSHGRDILHMCTVAKSLVKARLKNVSNAHITTDAWSDSRARGFGSLTVHYIDEEWTLETVPATVDHIKVNEHSSFHQVPPGDVTGSVLAQHFSFTVHQPHCALLDGCR